MVYLPALKDEQYPPSVGGRRVLEEELDHGDLKGVRICYSETGEQRLQYTSSSLGSYMGVWCFLQVRAAGREGEGGTLEPVCLPWLCL